MRFSMPKPLHGWRALAGEVGIIVVGVLVALGAGQVVDAWQWREKVAAAHKSIGLEINDQLDFSEEVLAFGPCRTPYLDALEAAITRGDSGVINRLHDVRPPFQARPWRSTAWESTMSTQVADHLSASELARYAFMFNSFNDLASLRDKIIADFAEATVGRLGQKADPAAMNQQLAAAERLRSHLALETVIARTMIDTAKGDGKSWKPLKRERDSAVIPMIAQQARLCEQTVRSLPSAR